VLGEEASVVYIDQDTLAWENIEFAKLQIHIPQRRSCRWTKNMKINDVMYNIAMEEEMLTYGGGKCKCYSWDSSDSISSSETYVDETSFSAKSCEEVNRQGEGEALWPNGEEAGGQTKDRGKLGISTSKVVFEETSTKSRDEKGDSCFSYTKEECRNQKPRGGIDLGVLSASASAPVYTSRLDEMAKVVVDVESDIIMKGNQIGSGHEGLMEAQCGLGWDPFLAKFQEDGPRPTMESGERKERSDSQESEMAGDQTEGKEYNNGGSEEEWEGKSSTEKNEAPKKEENNGGEDLAEHQSYNESGEDAGGINIEDPCVRISSLPKSPCRQRKEKGIVDLGDIFTLQRWRYSCNTEKVRALPPQSRMGIFIVAISG